MDNQPAQQEQQVRNQKRPREAQSGPIIEVNENRPTQPKASTETKRRLARTHQILIP
jgi:hypothetical protein